MAAKKTANKTTGTSYASLITQTEDQRRAEDLELIVEQAKLDMKQSVNSIEGDIIIAKGKVNAAQAVLKGAEQKKVEVKRTIPFSTQNLIYAEQARRQAVADLKVVEKELEDTQGWLTQVNDWDEELFQ